MSEIACTEAVIGNEADALLPVQQIQALPLEGAERGTSKHEVRIGYVAMLSYAVSFADRLPLVQSRTSPRALEFYLPPMTILLIQSMLTSICAGVCMLLFTKPREEIWSLTREQWRAVLLRSFFGTLRESLLITSLSLIPLGDAISIFFISPLLSAILAHIILDEAITPLDAVAYPVSILTALLVTRLYPPYHMGIIENIPGQDRVLGCSLVVGSALAEAVASVAARKASSVPTMISVLSEGLFGMAVSAALGDGYLGPTEGREKWIVILMETVTGVCAFAWQVWWTMGLKYVDVGRALIMVNLNLPFTYLRNWFRGEQVPCLVLVGSGIIICTSVMVAMQKMRSGN